MPLILLSIISILIQAVIYILLDRKGLKRWKYLVLLIFLLLNLFILPTYFNAEIIADTELRCGLPSMMLLLYFWTVGCGTVLLTHIGYIVVRNFYKIYKEK